MSWIPVAAWGAALAVATVLLGFAAYEIRWKAKRLTADLARLQALAAEAQRLQADVAEVQERAATIQRSMPVRTG